jgi:hypothetical protein
MIIREIITPYCEKCMKQINTQLGKPEILITTLCCGQSKLRQRGNERYINIMWARDEV